jgi:hypothetical protein
MKWPGALVCFVFLTAEISFAGAKAHRAVDGSIETAKTVTMQVMKEAGYTLNTQTPAGIVFSKELTGKQRTFVLDFLSPVACECISPRLYLTVNFSKTNHGTLETVSARIEHTELVARGFVPYNPWIIPHFTGSCETVRETPIFMHTQRLLNGLLEEIGVQSSVKTYANLTR